jgi:hypothetical protein
MRARGALTTGGLLLAWQAAQLLVFREIGSFGAELSALGVGLLVYGWIELHRDRVGRAVQDIAEAIDPLVTPPHVDIPEGIDEIHAPGHAHVRRDRAS